MSWVDDNIIPFEEDEINPEINWADGFHVDRTGKEWALSEMTTSHLRNTIKYFEEYDTSYLKKELDIRIKQGS